MGLLDGKGEGEGEGASDAIAKREAGGEGVYLESK